MTLLDASGAEIRSETSDESVLRCQSCGSDKIENFRMFGGHWKEVCVKCGTTTAQGRDDAEG